MMKRVCWLLISMIKIANSFCFESRPSGFFVPYEGCYTPSQKCGELAQEISDLRPIKKNVFDCCCVVPVY